jgi:hypothetical protein
VIKDTPFFVSVVRLKGRGRGCDGYRDVIIKGIPFFVVHVFGIFGVYTV